MTLTLFQGYVDLGYLKLQVVFSPNFVGDQVRTLYDGTKCLLLLFYFGVCLIHAFLGSAKILMLAFPRRLFKWDIYLLHDSNHHLAYPFIPVSQALIEFQVTVTGELKYVVCFVLFWKAPIQSTSNFICYIYEHDRERSKLKPSELSANSGVLAVFSVLTMLAFLRW